MKKKSRDYIKYFLWFMGIGFIFLNILIYNHTYNFTHFATENTGARKKTKPEQLSFIEKAKLAFTGVQLSKPVNYLKPDVPYETIKISADEMLEAWWMPVDSAVGTVLFFHGYTACKSSQVKPAEVLHGLGFNTMLIDFRGSGGSTGYETTIGFKEAKDVWASYQKAKEKSGDLPLVILGNSMGAAALMKAMQDFPIEADGLILESPFGSMYDALASRFRAMGAPPFPLAHLLMLHGSWQGKFNTYTHNPADYAKHIRIPVLLFRGDKDNRVSVAEITAVFENLAGEKKLVALPDTGHENYFNHDKETWVRSVTAWLEQLLQ